MKEAVKKKRKKDTERYELSFLTLKTQNLMGLWKTYRVSVLLLSEGESKSVRRLSPGQWHARTGFQVQRSFSILPGSLVA